MRFDKWVIFGAAVVIIALEAFAFTRASTDDIVAPVTTSTPEITTPDSPSAQPVSGHRSRPSDKARQPVQTEIP